MYTLITGATSGIGRSFALSLGSKGKSLILIGRNEKELKKLTHFLQVKRKVEVIPIQMDLTQTDSISKLERFLEKNKIQLEMVINNAGKGLYGPFKELDLEDQENLIDLNIKAFTKLSKTVIPFMDKGGTLLQLASIAAFGPGPYMATYYASKAYVLSFSLALERELKKEGIKVAVLCPGPTRTAFFERAKMEKVSFAKLFYQTSEEVVRYTYKQLSKNKTVIVPGIVNKMMVAGLRYLPLQVAAFLVALTQGEK